MVESRFSLRYLVMCALSICLAFVFSSGSCRFKSYNLFDQRNAIFLFLNKFYLHFTRVLNVRFARSCVVSLFCIRQFDCKFRPINFQWKEVNAINWILVLVTGLWIKRPHLSHAVLRNVQIFLSFSLSNAHCTFFKCVHYSQLGNGLEKMHTNRWWESIHIWANVWLFNAPL